MTNALIKLISIEKRYGKSVALELEELTIKTGRLHLLTGPNGSGKSTLLGILALLTHPDKGEILFSGERIVWSSGELNRLRKFVTLLHQSPYLFQGTVYDNVAFGLSVRGIRGSDARSKVIDALATVGLKGFGDRKISQLSGGEAQRVAMARALVIRPQLLLLDEPMANVDKESARVLEAVISALPDNGTTVVMSSHDPQQHERLDCEVIELLDGRLVNCQTYSHNSPNLDKEISLCPTLKMRVA
jgi:tungstate transport system ATP-binding protein